MIFCCRNQSNGFFKADLETTQYVAHIFIDVVKLSRLYLLEHEIDHGRSTFEAHMLAAATSINITFARFVCYQRAQIHQACQ